MNASQSSLRQVESILVIVSNFFGVKIADILGPVRTRALSNPRKAACYLIRQNTQMTLDSIGAMFGRDHTTVLYLIQSQIRDMNINPYVVAQVEAINGLLAKEAAQ